MKTHFVRDRVSEKFFRDTPDGHRPCAETKAEADLYEQEFACSLATEHYGADAHSKGVWEIIEATLAEYHSWRGRRGGRKKSPKKARTSKRNLRNYRQQAKAA